ncbi:PLP-dependent aminotransferase family protein [Rhodobacteraceae bacterium D3-12]|nr:PLP-dependent aminotransferase family protein [Rhodobacteraceae bacterium D3-12]
MSTSSLSDQSNLQSSFQAALFALSLDRASATPLHAQLTDALRKLILSGRAPLGARLPASRMLAAELSISRMTATTALDQLTAEGYLEARAGSGTFVAADLPHIAPPRPALANTPLPKPRTPLPFHAAIPDLALFPHKLWARHLERAWRAPDAAMLALPDPAGYAPLRRAITEHLSAWRGMEVEPQQVILTSGAAEAFELVARSLLAPGDTVLTEDPGFPPMRQAMQMTGLAPLAQPVDEDGFDIATAASRAPDARAALVTPSRHYPLGLTLPLSRRLALIDWAQERDALIIEDDYDSEFRYVGQPLPALAALDHGGRVFYIGSFSKLLSPALRLAYLVVPRRRLEAVERTMGSFRHTASMVPQPALANFMQSGEFAVHLRRMRRIYARRQKALLASLARHLPDHLVAQSEPSGMHIVARPGPALTRPDTEISTLAANNGLTLRALSPYFESNPQQGFIMGFAGFDESTLESAVKRLAALL